MYSPPNFIGLIKRRTLILAGFLPRMEQKRNAVRELAEKTELGENGVDGRIILKWLLK